MNSEIKGLKTPEENREYVEHMARVSFYFARRWLTQRLPDKPLSELIRDHTPVLYHGLEHLDNETKWNNPECQKILSKADELAALPPDEFENAMWEFVKDYAMKRADEFYPKSVGIMPPANWNCGSLRYDPPKPQLPPGWCVFHISNTVGPKSIFDDPKYLPACFQLLLKESEMRFGFTTLYTGTWLNEREEFLENFPDEWRKNLSKPDKDITQIPPWHFGMWGQIVTARGTINPKIEAMVREEGHLRYCERSSHCSYEAMKKHVKGRL